MIVGVDSHRGEHGPQRLLRTPVPYLDESLMGYVLRPTEENGYDAPKWIFEQAGMDVNVSAGGWPALYDPHSDLRPLERVLGLEGGELIGIAYRLCDEGCQVAAYGATLPKRLLRVHSPQLCPACLKQAAYHRGVWDLLPFTACPQHGLVLIAACPRCRKRIPWSRRRVSHCRCGLDLREAQAAKASPSTLDVSTRILQLCGHLSTGQISGEEKDNPLFDLILGDFCHVLTVLANNHLFIKRGYRLTAETDNLSSHEAYACAFRAFDCWPANFHKHLDEIKRRRGRGIWGSSLFTEIISQFRKPELHFAAIAVEDHVERNEWKDIPNRGTPPPVFRRFITKREACRRLRVNEYRLDNLIKNNKLRLAHRWHDSEPLVDCESIEELIKRLSRLLSMRLAAMVMGVEPRDIEDLVRHGCLRAASGPVADGLPEWRFDEVDLYSLINAVGDRITETVSGAQEELVSTDEIIRHLRRLRPGLGRFMRDVLDGNLAPVRMRKLPGLEGFLFRKGDVSGYLSRFGDKKGLEQGQQGTVPEYKLWTCGLVAVIEKNASIYPRGRGGVRDVSNRGAANIRDLVNIGRHVLFDSTPALDSKSDTASGKGSTKALQDREKKWDG
jgi:hypothetical protein